MPTDPFYCYKSVATSQELPETASPGRCATGPAQRSEHGPGAERPGLVTSQTSDTRICINPENTRLRRMKSGLLTAARLHVQDVPRWQVVMVTATYRPQDYYRPRHIADFLKAARAWASRQNFELRYAWCLEATKAGKEHYHILLWLPRNVTLPKADDRGWWPHGMTRTERARNAVGYLAKYASKGGNRKLPEGARIYGTGGLRGGSLDEWRWWRLPRWLRSHAQVTQNALPKRLRLLGWVLDSGEIAESPYRVEFAHGSIYLVLKEPEGV